MAKKGLKVTNLSRDKKIGVAAESLNELLKKSCDKLMVCAFYFMVYLI